MYCTFFRFYFRRLWTFCASCSSDEHMDWHYFPWSRNLPFISPVWSHLCYCIVFFCKLLYITPRACSGSCGFFLLERPDLYVHVKEATKPGGWLSGRTSVSDRRTFTGLHRTCSWWISIYMGKPSAVGQPTRPTQPFILTGSINE